jgi:RimJ/RimL family protein N-acetyltransferase
MGVIVVAEKSGSLIGFIAGLISPWFAHHQQRIIQEVIWWVNPEERGTRLAYRMIKEYEKEAREKGCCFTIMGTHDADNEDRLIRFYESCGFQHLQYEMIKEL